ncbi:MAG: trypsin-like peptidase domain-containing protein [Planctomycetota bacterium]
MPDRLTQPAGGICLFLAACLLLLPSRDATASEERRSAIVVAVEKVAPSVVNIRGEKTLPTPGPAAGVDAGRRVNGMGTGVVIDPRGYIITNFHVVDGVREIQVTLAGEKRHIATLVARDLETDLAIIKIDPDYPLPIVPIGTSSDLMPGETVIAVGNAYGYEHTVTRGIISALHRAVQVSDAQFYDDLIQTDASINPGNSGGPLLNIDGDMIGINVAVRAGAQGIGFAIPIDKALEVAGKMLASPDVLKTWHGITVGSESASDGKSLTIASVESDSPGSECGLEPGDVVREIEDQDVHRQVDFQRAFLGRKAGDKLKLSIERDGEPLKLDLVLADPPTNTSPGEEPVWEAIGIQLRPVPNGEFRNTYQTRYRGGLAVLDVRADSPAARQGIRPGDVLVGMHIWETVTLDNVSYILNRPDLTSFSPVKFFILRGNETLYGYMTLPMKTAQRP